MRPAIHPEDSLEYTRQMLIWGDVELDDNGRVIRREEPEYWKLLRVGSRGHGKTSMQHYLQRLHEEAQRIIDKTDELHRLVKGWRIAPPQPKAFEVDGFRWRCARPTAPQFFAPGTNGWYSQRAADIIAGRRTMADVIAEARRVAR